MSDDLFPAYESVYSSLPSALRTGWHGLHRVPGKYHEDLIEMPTSVRRYACILYLAHKGMLQDKKGQIKFALTPTELAHWYEFFVGEKPPPNELKASVEALKERNLVRFHRRRLCRVIEEEANTFRWNHHIFPVTANG